MIILETTKAMLEWRRQQNKNLCLGFVPTMGALHAGHESLIEQSVRENDLTVLSIFVNPTQFNQSSDFEKYPKTWEADLQLAERAGVDVVFAPKDKNELYPDGYRYSLKETEFSKMLCGEFRPGHFDGVLSVVLKLFQIVKPEHAYFGEKDYQQLSLIRGMSEALFLDLEVVACPTVREASGLAMSSRNMRLKPDTRLEIAPKLYQVMKSSDSLEDAKQALTSNGFDVEYLIDLDLDGEKRRFAAAWLEEVRLIDNVKI